jgi:hypothetical protein
VTTYNYVNPTLATGVPTPTHQVEVHRYADNTGEPWDPPVPPWDAAFVLINAVIEPLPGSIENGAGTQGITQYRIIGDPCDIDHQYYVIDPVTTYTYQVVWVAQVADPIKGIAAFASGFGHIEGELKRVEGLPSAGRSSGKATPKPEGGG